MTTATSSAARRKRQDGRGPAPAGSTWNRSLVPGGLACAWCFDTIAASALVMTVVPGSGPRDPEDVRLSVHGGLCAARFRAECRADLASTLGA